MAVQYVKDLVSGLKRELIRNRAAGAAMFAVVLMAVLYVSLHWPRQYIAEVTISTQAGGEAAQMTVGGAALNSPAVVRELIFSGGLAERIVLRVNPALAQMPPQDVEHAIQELRRSIQIADASAERNVTHMTVSAPTADQVEKTRRAMVDVLLEKHMGEKRESGQEAQSFLDEQVAKYREQLERADEKLQEFKSRNNAGANDQAVRERIARLAGDVDRQQAAIDESREKIRTLKARLETENQNPDPQGPYKALIEQRKTLTAQLDQLRLNYQDSYPDIVALKSQIQEVDQAIDQYRSSAAYNQPSTLQVSLREQLSAAETELKAQVRRHDSLRSSMAKENEVAAGLAANQGELADLTRAHDVAKQTYEELLARKESAAAVPAAAAGQGYKVSEPPIRVLQPLDVPAFMIYLAAPLLAVVVPIVGVAALVMFGPRLRSAALLSRKLPKDIPLLVVVPHRGAPASDRLLRRDLALLSLLAAILFGIYGFILYKFQTTLLPM